MNCRATCNLLMREWQKIPTRSWLCPATHPGCSYLIGKMLVSYNTTDTSQISWKGKLVQVNCLSLFYHSSGCLFFNAPTIATALRNYTRLCLFSTGGSFGWWRGTVARRSVLAGELSLSHARPSADGWPLIYVNHPLEVSQLGQLSLSSSWGQ